jgi:hypothetical protein
VDAIGRTLCPAVSQNDSSIRQRNDCRGQHEPSEDVWGLIQNEDPGEETARDVAHRFRRKVSLPARIVANGAAA